MRFNKKGQKSMVILGVGVIILVVVLGVIFSFLATNSVSIQTELNEQVALTSTSNTIINETITMGSGTGNTGNVSLTDVTFFGNGTNNTESEFVNISTEVNWTIEGEITISTLHFEDGDYNISYVYRSDVTGTTLTIVRGIDLSGLDFAGTAALGVTHSGGDKLFTNISAPYLNMVLQALRGQIGSVSKHSA